MKIKLCIAFLLFLLGEGPGPLQWAHSLYQQQQYAACLAAYRQALKAYPEQRAAISFNMAMAYEQLDSTTQAMTYYHQAIKPQYPIPASQAANNLAILLIQQQKYPEALQLLKDALIYSPENEHARYNYELLLRRLLASSPPSTNQQDQAQNPPPPASPTTDSRQPQPPGSRSRASYRRLPNTERAGALVMDTIPLARARELLDRMREQEIKFLQQLKKIPANPLPRNERRRDW